MVMAQLIIRLRPLCTRALGICRGRKGWRTQHWLRSGNLAFPVVCGELEAGQEHVLCLRGAAAAQPQTVGGMAQTTGTPPGGAGPPGSSEELESWRSFRFLNAFGQLKSTRNTEQPWTDSYVIRQTASWSC